MKINLRHVDLNLLTIFEAVIRTGKLSGAAESLGMTQPAVSSAVSRLRLTFKDDLFIRGRYGVEPTPRARELETPIRQALTTIQASLEAGNEFDPDSSMRTFSLAIGDYGELILLPALMAVLDQFQGQLKVVTYPELDQHSFDLLKQGQIDLYFDYHKPEDERLDYCTLSEEEAVVIARHNHPGIKGTLSKAGYLNADHVTLRFRHGSLTMLEDMQFDKKRIPRKVKAEVSQFMALPGLVAQSDCLATVPSRMAEYIAEREAIDIYPLPFKNKKNKTYMIWHRAMNQDNPHQWLREIIMDIVGKGTATT